MKIVNLYKYEDQNGNIITPNQRNSADIPCCYRLVADERKSLTKDGVNLCPAVDVDNTDGWYEVDEPIYEEEVSTE